MLKLAMGETGYYLYNFPVYLKLFQNKKLLKIFKKDTDNKYQRGGRN